jgi:hypothetical protein
MFPKKGVMNMGIKLFNKLPNQIRELEKKVAVSVGADILSTTPYILVCTLIHVN